MEERSTGAKPPIQQEWEMLDRYRREVSTIKIIAVFVGILIGFQVCHSFVVGQRNQTILEDIKRQNEMEALSDKNEMKEDIKSLVFAYTNLSSKMQSVGISTVDTTKVLQELMVKYDNKGTREVSHTGSKK